jgi:hypothetical protein
MGALMTSCEVINYKVGGKNNLLVQYWRYGIKKGGLVASKFAVFVDQK